MHSIIIIYLIKAFLRNAKRKENMAVTGAATASCFKRRL
jgi:hypothetical protein